MRSAAVLSFAVICLGAFAPQARAETGAVLPNDCRVSVGRVSADVLLVDLWAGTGDWAAEGPRGRVLTVAAFGVEGQSLSTPGPLIRVKAGALVNVQVRNTLAEPLELHGLCYRPGSCASAVVGPGESRRFTFRLTAAGTYHYWGTTTHAGFTDRRTIADSQLGGVIVVDPPGRRIDDRILVITLADERDGSNAIIWDVLAVNGLSWPFTERLTYDIGDNVRWRVVNLSPRAHPMHLHGFSFTVESLGDGIVDRPPASDAPGEVVTYNMQPADTMTVRWTPTRAGNWVFHCHILAHIMPNPAVPAASASGESGESAEHGHDEHAHGDDNGMRGLVIGIVVKGPAGQVDRADSLPSGVRSLRLTVSADHRHGAKAAGYRFDAEEDGRPLPRVNSQAAPGPTLVLRRGQPVAVDVVNTLTEPTAIHWHGIELESFDDGVVGFGGDGVHVTPAIEPGGHFVARFTPSRAGTFIYHTHWHNEAQLSAGLYGAIVVVDDTGKYDPSVDHLLVIGLDGPPQDRSTVPIVNGQPRPGPLTLKAGVPNRLRMINITPNNAGLYLEMISGLELAEWTLVGKDGTELVGPHRARHSARLNVSVGETYDVELTLPPTRGAGLWMELRRANGEVLAQWPVNVRP